MPIIVKQPIDTYYHAGKYYLYVNSHQWGDHLRFGDFIMSTTMLYIVKKIIIRQEPEKYNFNNLFFSLNITNKATIHLSKLSILLSFFDKVWTTNINAQSNDIVEKNNISQIFGNGCNIWQLKCYLQSIGYHLSDNDFILSDKLLNIVQSKEFVYILPVFGKKYNTERNWSNGLLFNIIDKYNENKIKILSIDNYKLSHDAMSELMSNPFIDVVETDNWIEIIIDIIAHCKYFISGDCGMSHFICSLHPKVRPDHIEIYYNTRSNYSGMLQIKKIVKNAEMVKEEVDYKPLAGYNHANIKVINF